MTVKQKENTQPSFTTQQDCNYLQPICSGYHKHPPFPALLLQKVKEIAGTIPSVITGDFNAVPTDEPIQVLMDETNPLVLTDSKAISQTPHYGPTGTFNAFKSKEERDEPIDYIFLKGKWRVLSHASISQTWGGRFASDHFAVMARIFF